MDIQPHPKNYRKLLVTVENGVEEDVIADALPMSWFGFKRIMVDPWINRKSNFPYTTTFSETVLGPLAIEAFCDADPNTEEGRICEGVGHTALEYLKSFQSAPSEPVDQPAQS